MTKVRIDTDWLGGYAKQVAAAGEELRRASGALNAAPLGPEAFGELGRELRTAESYRRAADLLRGQLTRAGEALASAATELGEVIEHYRGGESDSALDLRRSERRP
ncbi:hypothetical protein JOF53_005052 [Crossiella equi]|uniref:Excreted virulence factor EspC (Type VII ESX diderm) n=1 Tax=Crossiella equi TaxID=130796 RepID=A0ABS5AHX8_9PSEU|nr:hypothetical protein [Crossiella equi]MBP2476180.1 hypothetical protein [Crossiella equi]